MKLLKIILLGLFILLILPLVHGRFLDDGSCETRTTCNFTIQVVNETTGNPINDAFCNMTIHDPNLVLVGEFVMDNNSRSGFWTNNLSFTTQGEYPSDCFCQFNPEPTVTDIANCSFIVGSPQNYNNVLHALFVVIPLGLIWLSRWTQELSYATLGSMLMIVFGIIIYRGDFPFLQFNSGLMTTAFALAITGLGMYFMLRVIQEYWWSVED